MSVLVFAQHRDGTFRKAAWELLSYGKALALQAGAPLVAVAAGAVAEEELRSLGRYGAAKVIGIPSLEKLDDRAYAAAVAEIAQQEAASIVIFANDFTGRAVAPRVAVRLEAACITGVASLPNSLAPFSVSRSIFAGKANARVVAASGTVVLTLARNSFPITEAPENAAVETRSPTQCPAGVTVLETQQTSGNRIPVTDAEIIVSGGRGMKGPEAWGPIEELASLLGAATACSRPVADEGWRPHYEHVGQTGKVVSPNLYIACGISGAIQHLAGISGSKCIVAINTDPEAPIFEAAQYGIVGDAHKVLPDLIAALKSQ